MGALGYLINFSEGGSWYTICALASFAAVLVYGIIFSISRAFYWKNLENKSKSEILQGVSTLFMVIIVVSAVAMAEEFAIGYFLGEGSEVHCGEDIFYTDDMHNTFEIIKCRFSEHGLAIAKVQSHIKTYADTDLANAFVYKSQIVYILGAQVLSGSWPMFPWYKETENYRIMSNFSTSVLIKINTILIMLKFIQENMLTIFLPVGLFLRAFPPTRGIGAFFIATAIGFYFIFPVLFVFTDPGFVQVQELPEPAVVVPSEEPCYPSFSGIASELQGASMQSSLSIGQIQQAASEIAKFNVFVSVQLFVVFVITVIMIRYMTYILGGETYAIMRYLARVV